MKEGVVSRDPVVAGNGLDVFEKGGEPADDLAGVQRVRDFVESFEADSGFFRPSLPQVAPNFGGFKLSLQGSENSPIKVAQLDYFRV